MLLVDTYNALHVTGVLPPHLAGLDPRGLAELVAASRLGRGGVRLICDGAPVRGLDTGLPEGVEIRFAGPGRDADSLIERLLLEDPAPRRHTVVSSDRRVQKAAKRRRATVLSSEAFLSILAADAARGPAKAVGHGKPEAPLDAVSVGLWLRDFGITAAELREIEGRARRLGDPAKRPPTPVPAAQGDVGKHPPRVTKPPAAAPARSPPPIDDPVLRAAMAMWPGRIDPDDLDMARWLRHQPIPKDARHE